MTIGRRRIARWARRALLAGLGVVAATLLALTVSVRGWSYPVHELSVVAGGPLIITDRNGDIVRQIAATSGNPGRASWVQLQDIPPLLVTSFVVAEDARFFEHAGVDWRGALRAAYLNLRERRLAYGGSTITMQLVRMLRSPGAARTVRKKVAESVLAMRLERAVPKRTILEHYLNRAYFGNGAYGVGAAARLYFDKPAQALSDAEATLLAVLPRAPSAYDPLTNLAAALARRDHVFTLLRQNGVLEQSQIEQLRKNTPQPSLTRPQWRARHFTDHLLSEIPDEVKARGGIVRTSIDMRLQEQLEPLVAQHVAHYAAANLDQAGVVVLDTASGEVLAMVGSSGWEREGGQINMVTRRRHPGSALKPFVYALAIDGGDTPATIAYDIPDVPSAYEVLRLTQKERGPTRYREALAGSYNLAAVHTLERVGIPAMMSFLRRTRVGSLDGNTETYGLRLALGSAKVRLIDLANAYRLFALGGQLTPHRSVVDVRDRAGARWQPAPPVPTRFLSTETAWLVMDMMADPNARRPAFGSELPVDLPFAVAVKTGTARGFADTVTIAVTEQFTVAAWGGNVGGEPTQGLIAMEASAPLVRAGLLAAANGRELTLPRKPATIASAEVCPVSGMLRGPHCSHGHRESFARSNVPDAKCSWHQVDGGVRYPAEISAWAERTRSRGGRVTLGAR